jgi:hypothetical protein
MPLSPITPIENFKASVGDHIEKKFKETVKDWEREVLLSVLLDPRAKDFYFVDDETEREEMLRKAQKFAIDELGGDEEEVISAGCVLPTVQRRESMGRFLSSLLGAASRVSTSTGPAMELTSYLLLPRIPIAVDNEVYNPLSWWRGNERAFPKLATLARKYLVMLTSSASVERVFSLAGWVVDKRRCSLMDSSIEDRLMVIANKQHLL